MYRWSVWACEDGGAMAGEAQKRNRERMAELPVSGARHAGGMKTSPPPCFTKRGPRSRQTAAATSKSQTQLSLLSFLQF